MNMLLTVFAAVLSAFLLQGANAVCQPTVIAPKGLRLDTPTDIYINFHGCPAEVSGAATLASLPNRNQFHSQVVLPKNLDHRNKPVKITLEAKSDKIEVVKEELVYMAVLGVSYCGGPECVPDLKVPDMEVLINKTRGYIFMTTGRPAYRPNEEVQLSVVLTDQDLFVGNPRVVTVHIRTPVELNRTIVESTEINIADGFGDTSYDVPADPTSGVWWAEAHMDGVKMAEKSFLIDRYELPTFQVKIIPKQYFILPTQKFIEGTLTAMYSYGEEVNGFYYMSFKLQRADGSEQEFYKIPREYGDEAAIPAGTRAFKIPIAELEKVLHVGETLEQFADEGEAKVIIMASVTGHTESVFESAVVDNIVFTRSPFVIDYSRSARFYLPNTVYELKVTVRDAVSNLPLPDISVTLRWGDGDKTKDVQSDKNGEIYHEIDDFIIDEEAITVKTDSNQFEKIDQVQADFTVRKYAVDRQLGMRVNKQVADVGDEQHVTFFLGLASPKDIRFFVISRGQFIHADSEILRPGQVGEVSASFQVTAAMVPNARVIAYYDLQNSITSNSVWFDVVNMCKNELIITPKQEEVLPGAPVDIDVEGAPNSSFYITAVDRAAYFVHNGTRLNRHLLWSKMEEYDTACSRKGGRDAVNVFEEAGLSFNSLTVKRKYRNMFCVHDKKRKRKRRSAPQVEAAPVNNYPLEKCETDGQRISYDVTCAERVVQIKKNMVKLGVSDADAALCISSFNRKCNSRKATSYISRSAVAAQDKANEVRAQIRSDFAENWLFDRHQIRNNGMYRIKAKAKDSITIFDIDAFGLSRTSPMCVAQSKSIKVFKDFFIQLYLPYSVRLREQANIRFSVFNYGDKQRDVEIMLRHSDDLCSKFRSEDFKYLQTMRINANSASASTFAILPLRIPKDNGKATIEIKIAGEDHVQKQLLIEEPGLHNESSATILLTTNSDNPHAVVQAKDIIFDIPTNSVMQHTKKCWVNVYAHPMGPNIEIDEFEDRLANMDSFIRAPGACGEQNMIYVAPSIYVYQYRFAVLGDKVTQGQKQQAIKNINAAYTYELRYLTNKANKKAFSVFVNQAPSTWLTAFVTRVFSAGSIISPTVQKVHLCNALGWLLKQQNGDGSFNPNRAVIHREMIGDVTEPISLAAYVSITLQECVVTCPLMSSQLMEGARKAVNYLKAHKEQATGTPYVLAMGAYALSIADPLSEEARDWNQLLHDSKENDGEYIFWRGTRGKSSTIETTAYALLAELHLHGITEDNDELTRSVSHWLISKRNSLGGFSATQDTVVALQALTYYMRILETASKAPPETDIQVTLIAKSEDCKWFGENEPLVIAMGVEDTMRRKQYEVPQPAIADGLEVRVSGVGTGSMSYRCTWRQYNEDGNCHFNIKVTVEEDPDQNPATKILKVRVAKPHLPRAQMSIIDVGLLTGFVPDKDSLKKLCIDDVVDGVADRYEITSNTIKFYLDDIGPEGVTLAFKIKDITPIVGRQPASVSAYDYYEPDIRCTQFYNLPGEEDKIRSQCSKPKVDEVEMCKCAEGDCPVCRTREQQLSDTKCSDHRDGRLQCDSMCNKQNKRQCYRLHRESCNRDYLYVVTVKEVGNDPSSPNMKYFTATVDEIFRATAAHVKAQDSVVKFTMRSDCFKKCYDKLYTEIAEAKTAKTGNFHEAEDYLTVDRVLLVYGSDPVKDNGGYVYDLSESGRLEVVLSAEQCNCDDNDKRCKSKLKKNRKKEICQMKSFLRASHIKGCD